MTITLELPQELEQELVAEATQLGLSLSEYAVRLLASTQLVGVPPKTGAELVDYWEHEGLIGSRADITDSQNHARKLREQAERRTRE